MSHNKNLCGVACLMDFIPKTITNKLNTKVIITSKVAQTITIKTTQTKVVLDVGYLDRTPSVAIMLPFHALH
jgi:hypothetical protein